MEAIISLMSIAGLWSVLTLWRRLCVDEMREELFSLRDDLFNLGKKIGFRHPLYIRFEYLINGTIRFGYSMSLFNVFLFRFLNELKYPGHKIESVLHLEIIDEINDLPMGLTRDQFIGLKRRYEASVTWFFIKSSILFMALIGGVFIFYLVKELFNGMSTKTKGFYVSLKDSVLEVGYAAIKEFERQAESQQVFPAAA